MLASRLSQFGLRPVKTATVKVGIGQKEIGFGVRLYECEAAGGRKLLHVELFHPDHGNAATEFATEGVFSMRGSLFWVRVMIYFQLAIEQNQRTVRSAPAIDSALLRRTQLLGHIGVAFPQRSGALERRTISVRKSQRTADTGRETGSLEIGIGGPRGRAEIPDSDLERFAMAFLMGVNGLTEDDIRKYMEFEKSVRKQMEDLLAKYPGPGEWRTAYREMNHKLSRIRKNADDAQRERLSLLQAACDVSLMHMYQYAAGAVLKTAAVSTALDAVSLAYNRTMHAVQDRLGGIVPAIHPLWPVCLKTPRIVNVLYDCSENPESIAGIKAVNACFSEVIRKYVEVLEPVFDDSIDSLDAPIGDGELTQGDIVGETDRFLVDAQSGVKDLLDILRRESENDRDVEVAYAVVYDRLDVKAAAAKFACSIGEISKKKQRGLAKMRETIERMGLTRADVLGAVFVQAVHVKPEAGFDGIVEPIGAPPAHSELRACCDEDGDNGKEEDLD